MSTSTLSSIFKIPRSPEEFFGLYEVFLSNFPEGYHGIISIALVILLVYSLYQVIKKNFIFIILLVILIPQSVPIIKIAWSSLLEFLQYLIRR